MDSEESRLLIFARDRLNASILAGRRLELEEALTEAITEALYDLEVIGEERRAALSESINRRAKSRDRHSVAVRRRIEKSWGQVLHLFDECIATAEELNSGFIESLSSGALGKKVESFSVRRYGHEHLLGGAPLKVLLLAGLQARACTTATEISLLLRAGLPQAAESRTRSLHEQTIISLILSNDKTYEICERYHDSAYIEELRYFRSHNLHAEGLGWQPIPTEELRNAEEFVALAVKNWGRDICTQYGWAGPLFPKLRPKSIRFSDLEHLVEGELLRPNYISLNNSIHAGPTSVIRQADFTKRHLMVTRPIADYDAFAATAGMALWFLLMITDASAKSITWLAENYDDYLDVGELFRRTDEALKLLKGRDPEAFR